MSGAALPTARIATLDIVRGVAVMGILAMNIVGFAMPDTAYLNPMAYGTNGPADLAAWVFSFILIDGKMRGLFSFLFGASLLLVVERAEANGQNPAEVHYSRMVWLLVFGLIHFYLVWWGDILSLYAPVGMIAYLFRHFSRRQLLHIGTFLILVQFALFALTALSFFQQEAAAAAPERARPRSRSGGTRRRGSVPIRRASLRGSSPPIAAPGSASSRTIGPRTATSP